MAIHSTGAISFQDLINEFGTGKPISLGQMYARGGFVPEANSNVPKTGAISLGNFYGATAAFVLDYNVTADMFNLSATTILADSGWDGITPVILTVNISTDIVVSSNNTSIDAMTIKDLPSGSVIQLINNGYIIGMGGAGGANRVNGEAGGNALFTNTTLQVTNNGTIAGGGGGGGNSNATVAGGGGGRSGRQNSGVRGNGNPGQGTFSRAGAGGYGGNNSVGFSSGGAGGNWGSAGVTPSKNPTYGGAGGSAVKGNSLINWVSEGTIMGSRLN